MADKLKASPPAVLMPNPGVVVTDREELLRIRVVSPGAAAPEQVYTPPKPTQVPAKARW